MWEYGSDVDPVEFLDDRNVQYTLQNNIATTQSEEAVLDVEGLAAYLKISRRSVYNLAGSGEVPAVKVAGQWRFYRPVIDGWLQEKTKRAMSGGA
ncbi:MAG TPA: helix-turn-helix domain-containing protein [Caldilineae bacterium]|nr:helix-turn-helix domain-containing protein [Caldilineae bacterium]